MSKFIDVTPDKWYYNEIVEASNIILEDGEPLIRGIPYNVFQDGKPYIYKEFKAVAGQKEFELDEVVIPTADNPLYVYVNGVQTVYKSVTQNNGKTIVTLYSGVPANAIVSIASSGVPKVNEFNRPAQTSLDLVRYPSVRLQGYANYYYNRFYRGGREYVSAFGKYLRRVDIPPEEWNENPDNRQAILRKYIGYNNDVYFIAPDGILHVPYNLNGVTCKVTYLTKEDYIKVNTEEVIPVSQYVLHSNRAFPDANITRAEAFVLIDRLRRTFYRRFSDSPPITHNLDVTITAYEGQRSVSVPGRYEVGKDDLKVYLNGDRQRVDRDYKEYDEYTIVFLDSLEEGDEVRLVSNRTKSLNLEDVGTVTNYYRIAKDEYQVINGTVGNENPDDDSWWAPHILSLEREMLSSGELMVDGMPVGETFYHNGVKTVTVDSQKNPLYMGDERWFMPETFMTRAQAVVILNRFRKLMMEKFL